ncbi:CocE/NonD family hydrolase [Methanococcoides methylutens]|uniref:CocE/NonD family hydrolase n=1 Tax=Methanococcoides methylutens TaxID=2226 RepID=UPI004044BA1D
MIRSNAQKLQDLFAQVPKKKYRGLHTHSHYLTMRDGVQIAVDVLLPVGLETGARLPVVLTMTRYWRSFELRVPEPTKKAPIAPRETLADDLVLRGFAMVIVDARGSGASTGVSRYPFTAEEIADYGEVAAWAVAQPWCNGNVGAVGISYEGTTAQLLLASGVRAVKGVVPQQFEFDLYTDIALPGGIPNEAFFKVWSEGNEQLDSNKLPNWFPIPWYSRWMLKGVRPVDADRKSHSLLAKALKDHQANVNIQEAISQITFRDDKFGNTDVTLDDFSVFAHKDAIEASGSALFLWGSWLDSATADTVVRTFNTFSNPQVAVIGAWAHEMNSHASPYTRPKSKPDPNKVQQWEAIAQFFEQALIQGKPPQHKTLFYYTLGAETWNQSDSFPLDNTEMQTWYFHPNDHLSPVAPTSDNDTDTYRVDFSATTGTNNRWHTGLAKPVIYPARSSEDKRLLTYTSPVMEHDLEITGFPIVTLYVSSTEDDGAFFVYLEDIDESGVVHYITEGMLRGIHRKHSDEIPPYFTLKPYHTFKLKDATPLPRGETVELTFSLLPTSVLIRRGHRIRVAIAGADKDTFARIPSKGIPSLQFSHNQNFASCIRLPIVI